MESEIWQVYKDKGLVILGIDLQESASLVKSWANKKGFTYTILLDESRDVWNQYGMGYIPHNVIIDQQMIVKYTYFGYNRNTLKSIIESNLLTKIEEQPLKSYEGLELSSYPNPFRNEINFTIEPGVSEPLELAVYDILGRNIKSLVKHSSGNSTIQISWDGKDASGREVPEGLFFVVVKQGHLHKTLKIIKVR